jgi:hypothetical protein
VWVTYPGIGDYLRSEIKDYLDRLYISDSVCRELEACSEQDLISLSLRDDLYTKFEYEEGKYTWIAFVLDEPMTREEETKAIQGLDIRGLLSQFENQGIGDRFEITLSKVEQVEESPHYEHQHHEHENSYEL